MNSIDTIGYEEESLKPQAKKIAAYLNYSLNKDATLCLFLSKKGLALKIPHFSLLYADFTQTYWNKRKSEGKKQGLVRACKPARGINILDATAGWGRDAAILSSFGAEVLMLERHPVMAALLEDALVRREEVDKEVLNLSLVHQDAFSYLNPLQKDLYPDIIYIDPMHPERQKSALVKKEMQVLQHLIGVDEDALALIKLAITRVKQRVVVKWPQKIKPLLPPTFAVEGKTIRFDIYLP